MAGLIAEVLLVLFVVLYNRWSKAGNEAKHFTVIDSRVCIMSGQCHSSFDVVCVGSPDINYVTKRLANNHKNFIFKWGS